jgi:hypothetical protein
MDASYEQFYFVTWSESRIVDHNLFYKKLTAILPSRTKVYGGQETCTGSSETGLVCYHALIALCFVPRQQRSGNWGQWPAWASLKKKLGMVVRRKDLGTGENECVRDTERINIYVPSRGGEGTGLRSVCVEVVIDFLSCYIVSNVLIIRSNPV